MKGMMKRFNITGSCNPERHYMVDTAERFAAVEKMIDMGDYFTISFMVGGKLGKAKMGEAAFCHIIFDVLYCL